LIWAVLGIFWLSYTGWLFAQDAKAPAEGVSSGHAASITLWEPLFSPKYALYERIALIANVVVALAGLGYALMLVGQVKNAPQGTPKMQAIAQAVREGANAYLYRQ